MSKIIEWIAFSLIVSASYMSSHGIYDSKNIFMAANILYFILGIVWKRYSMSLMSGILFMIYTGVI